MAKFIYVVCSGRRRYQGNAVYLLLTMKLHRQGGYVL